MIEITQADLDAAQMWVSSGMDGDPYIQALASHFARHRIQARAEALEEAAQRLEREWPGPAANIVRTLPTTRNNLKGE